MGTNGQKLVVAVIAIIVIIWLVNIFNDEFKTKGEMQQSAQAEKLDSWKKETLTEQNVKNALAIETDVTNAALEDLSYVNSITKITIADDLNGLGKKDILIYYTVNSSWDETHFVKTAGRVAIAACSTLFQNPDVNSVSMLAETKVIDQNEKSSLDTGVQIDIGQATAAKIDWQKTADRSGSYPGDIYGIADRYYIHPEIMRNVKTDEVTQEIVKEQTNAKEY